jgi:hypothetical protein
MRLPGLHRVFQEVKKMILPLMMPVPGLILNLSQICSYSEGQTFRTPSELVVNIKMANGDEHDFSGKEAEIVKGEIAFAFNTYRKFILGLQQSESQVQLVQPGFPM